MIGWILATYCSLPASHFSFHWGPVNRGVVQAQGDRRHPLRLELLGGGSGEVAQARVAGRGVRVAFVLGQQHVTAAHEGQGLPLQDGLGLESVARPMEDRAAQAVSTLLVEAGVTPEEAERSSSSSPVAISTTEAVTFPPVRAASETTPWM